ncbi:MAG: hypothetical protein JO353_02170 [Phycisphaerae bacterium]|nr:hypothetical protein [Phycisphaerae bacterium]
MKITSHSPQNAVTSSPVNVHGTCLWKPCGEWFVFTRVGKMYWPQSRVTFGVDGRAWFATAHVNMETESPSTILLAEVTEDIERLIAHYFATGERTGWAGIEMDKLPPGIRIADSVIVHKRQPAA